jgi:hypothetical protein
LNESGEHAGYTISGHILGNHSILDPLGDSFSRLPVTTIVPRAPILHAIRHGHRQFLAQSMVHRYLVDDWKGGGWRLYTRTERMWHGSVLVLTAPLIISMHCLLLMVFALCPSLGSRYAEWFQFNKATTIVRLKYGLVFVPAFRWFVNEILDLSITIIFSTLPMMPFRASSVSIIHSDHADDAIHSELFGVNSWLFFYLWFACIGAALQELGELHDALFQAQDVVVLWRETLSMLVREVGGIITAAAEGAAGLVESSPPRSANNSRVEVRRTRRLISLFETQIPGVNTTLEEASKSALKSAQAVLQGFHHAATTTLKCALDPHSWIRYLQDNLLDVVARCLCITTLVLAMLFSYDDLLRHQQPTTRSSMGISSESVLSLAVLVLWVRKLKIMMIFRLTGTFVYMVFRMFRDVLLWLGIYLLLVVAFSAATHILFRNQYMDSGYFYRSQLENPFDFEENCAHMEEALRSMSTTIMLMLESTFEGSGSSWQCYYYSHTPVTAVLLHGLFTVTSVVVLMNALIAMSKAVAEVEPAPYYAPPQPSHKRCKTCIATNERLLWLRWVPILLRCGSGKHLFECRKRQLPALRL